jgi:hypothetical protein
MIGLKAQLEAFDSLLKQMAKEIRETTRKTYTNWERAK